MRTQICEMLMQPQTRPHHSTFLQCSQGAQKAEEDTGKCVILTSGCTSRRSQSSLLLSIPCCCRNDLHADQASLCLLWRALVGEAAGVLHHSGLATEKHRTISNCPHVNLLCSCTQIVTTITSQWHIRKICHIVEHFARHWVHSVRSDWNSDQKSEFLWDRGGRAGNDANRCENNQTHLVDRIKNFSLNKR